MLGCSFRSRWPSATWVCVNWLTITWTWAMTPGRANPGDKNADADTLLDGRRRLGVLTPRRRGIVTPGWGDCIDDADVLAPGEPPRPWAA